MYVYYFNILIIQEKQGFFLNFLLNIMNKKLNHNLNIDYFPFQKNK